MTTPNIIERVRRLLALAESSNVHEAAAAAAKAQELMSRHQLDMAALEVESGAEDEPILQEELARFRGTVRAPWRGVLAEALASANGCDVYSGRRTDADGRIFVVYKIVGLASSAGAVRYLFAFLAREVDRLAVLEAKRRNAPRGRAWLNSFRLGAACELRTRISDAHWRAMHAARGSAALARIDRTAERVAETMASLNLTNGRRTAKYSHSDAFAAGALAGRRIPLGGERAALGAGAAGALRGQA